MLVDQAAKAKVFRPRTSGKKGCDPPARPFLDSQQVALNGCAFMTF
jgi:hypothetical protein